MGTRVGRLVRSGAALLLMVLLCMPALPVRASAGDAPAEASEEDTAEAAPAYVKGRSIAVGVTRSAADVRAGTGYGWDPAVYLRAKALTEGMSLEDKIGQLVIIQSHGSSMDSLRDWTSRYHPAGFVVFGGDFDAHSGPADFKSAMDELQGMANVPLIIAVDEEGGTVVRASSRKKYRDRKFEAPQAVKNRGGTEAVREDAAVKAEFLEGLGVNLNLAPVADTSEKGGAIYSRTYGGTYSENAQYVAAAVDGMEGNGMGTTLKHFPNYGSSVDDTHTGAVVNYVTKESLLANDVLPFAAGIKAGNRMVMITHNNYINIDDVPASMSAVIYDILRTDLGFDGVAVTDGLDMSAATLYGTDVALKALQAGADMAMIGDIKNKATVGDQIETILAAARKGELPMDRIDEACTRVLAWKISHGLTGAFQGSLGNPTRDEIVSGLPRPSVTKAGAGSPGPDIRIVQHLRSVADFSLPFMSVYRVDAAYDGETCYSNLFGIGYDETDKPEDMISKEIVIPGTESGIPAGADVTVTLAYAGPAYGSNGSESRVSVDGGERADFEFTLAYTRENVRGTGIVNGFLVPAMEPAREPDGFELPDTGSAGTLGIMAAGSLCAGAGLACMALLRKKGGGDDAQA